MKARGGGAILMSTSSSVKEPIPNLGLSTVLRASVSALSKTLALELAADKIRVNQIIPGRIDTDRVKQLDEIAGKKQGITADEAKAKSMATIPMGRYGETPRVRPRGGVPAVGRGRLHDRRDRAGGRRPDQRRPVRIAGGGGWRLGSGRPAAFGLSTAETGSASGVRCSVLQPAGDRRPIPTSVLRAFDGEVNVS